MNVPARRAHRRRAGSRRPAIRGAGLLAGAAVSLVVADARLSPSLRDVTRSSPVTSLSTGLISQVKARTLQRGHGRTNMKLVAYLRVSTDRQAEEGLGLDVQARGIRRWDHVNGHRIAMVTRDEGVSGSNGIDGRIGLHDALAAVRHGTTDGVVVYRLDRLARKLTVQEATLAKLWDTGGTAFAVDIGEVPRDDPDDPMKTALRQMVGVFAQLERGMIAARLRSGRLLKAERGGYAGFGAPPYGTHSVDGELVVDPSEQEAVERAVTLRSSGASLRAIAEMLTAEGYLPRRADRWHPETLRRMLARTR